MTRTRKDSVISYYKNLYKDHTKSCSRALRKSHFAHLVTPIVPSMCSALLLEMNDMNSSSRSSGEGVDNEVFKRRTQDPSKVFKKCTQKRKLAYIKGIELD